MNPHIRFKILAVAFMVAACGLLVQSTQYYNAQLTVVDIMQQAYGY